MRRTLIALVMITTGCYAEQPARTPQSSLAIDTPAWRSHTEATGFHRVEIVFQRFAICAKSVLNHTATVGLGGCVKYAVR